MATRVDTVTRHPKGTNGLSLPKVLRIIQILLCVIASPALAIDTLAEEKTCQEIGFKPKTDKFVNCVLELYERSGGQTASRPPISQTTIKPAAVGDGSDDDQTCQSYGFGPGTSAYADCRMKVDMARREAQKAHARYKADLAAYEAQVANASRQRESERNLRLMELGLGMMSGGGRGGSSSSVTTARPPVAPSNQNIFLPNGQMITCNTSGNVTNCF